MTDRSRQTNAGLAVTVLLVALVVLSSVGAVVLVGTAPVAAQSNETGDAGDGATTGAPPGGGPSGNTTADSENDSSSTGNDTGGDSSDSDRIESALPDTGSGTNETASTNESGNTTNETGNSSSESETYQPEGNDDNGMFSISIDPVGLLISFFEPVFTLGTTMLVEMASAMQSSAVYPMQDGSVAIGGEPDSELMSVLQDYWYSVGLVAGAAIWLVMTMLLYILGMVWPPTPTYQEIKIAQQEAWLKLVLIPFSWALGTIILFIASFVLNAVPLEPEVMAPDTSSIAANNAAAGISVLLLYAFGGPFALAIAFTFFMTWLFVYIIFPTLPILIAMSVPKVWIMKGVAESFENVVQKFPSAAFFPVPAVIVLSAGYWILGSIENFLPGPAEWGAVPASAVAIVVIWILAFIASMYMFWSKSLGSGAGAILAGTVGIGAISSALGRLGGGGAAAGGAAAGSATGSAVGSSASALPGSAENAISGHALGSGESSTAGALGSGDSSSGSLGSGGSSSGSLGGGSASGLDSGMNAPATAGASTGTNPSGTAIPPGSGSGSSSGSEPAASSSPSGTGSPPTESEGSMPGRIRVEDPSPTPIESEDQLPDQEYRVGSFTGTGPGSGIEFDKMLDRERPPEQITGDLYSRANDAYAERDLYVRGEDDHQYYDVDPLHDAKAESLNLSEAEQHAESRSTVSDSREF